MQPMRLAGLVVGVLFSGAAAAAALGSGGIDENPPPVKLEPAKPAPPAAAAAPAAPATVQVPVVVAPPPIKPTGSYSLTYDIDRNAGVAGHIVLGERSVWLWSLSGSWSDDDERYVGSSGHITSKTSDTQLAVETGYRRLLSGSGPTRTFMDSTIELGYRERAYDYDSNLSDNTFDAKSSMRDTHAALSFKMGFEYFFNPAFSLEGAAGVTITYTNHSGRYSNFTENYIVDRSGHNTNLELFDAGLRVNYYW